MLIDPEKLKLALLAFLHFRQHSAVFKGPFTKAKISTYLSSRWLLCQNKI
jgi:hypothetical protein